MSFMGLFSDKRFHSMVSEFFSSHKANIHTTLRVFQCLLPLNCSRGFGGEVVDHPVDLVHLLEDSF
mgnify:CR=1 FL=1